MPPPACFRRTSFDTLSRKAAALILLGIAFVAGPAVHAQDIARGRALFSELPAAPSQGSCISCHGNPAHGINNILVAAGDPNRIVRATNTVSAMGFLRAHLVEQDFADLAAFLASVVPENGEPLRMLPYVDHFGWQPIGEPGLERAVVIENRQTVPLAVAAVVSSRAARYPLTHDCPPLLAPAASCTARVRFVPGFAGSARGLVSVLGTDGRTLRSAVVSGIGVTEPAARLDWLTVPSMVDFVNTGVGGTASRAVVLSNGSAWPARLDAVRVLGPQAEQFSLAGDCLAAPIAPGADCRITLSHAPTVAGDAVAWVEVAGSARSPTLLRLAGSALPAPAASTPPPAASSPPGGTAAGGEGGSGGGALSIAALLAAALAVLFLALASPRGLSR